MVLSKKKKKKKSHQNLTSKRNLLCLHWSWFAFRRPLFSLRSVVADSSLFSGYELLKTFCGIARIECQQSVETSLRPVSYTHLDVYKRQSSNRVRVGQRFINRTLTSQYLLIIYKYPLNSKCCKYPYSIN